MKYAFVFPFLLAACGAQDEAVTVALAPTEATPGTEALKDAEADMMVEFANNLPMCELKNEGKIAFAKDEKQFYVCTEFSWVPVDMKGAKGENGTPGASGTLGAKGDKGDKGEKGDTGAVGANGAAGAAGTQGAQGIAGTQGIQGAAGTNGTENKITRTITCEGSTSANLYIDNGLILSYRYEVSILSSGDVHARASVYGIRPGGLQVPEFGNLRALGSGHAQAATAPVVFSNDVLGSVNGGKWTVSLSRANLGNLLVTFIYEDPDVSGAVQTWTRSPLDCSVANY